MQDGVKKCEGWLEGSLLELTQQAVWKKKKKSTTSVL